MRTRSALFANDPTLRTRHDDYARLQWIRFVLPRMPDRDDMVRRGRTTLWIGPARPWYGRLGGVASGAPSTASCAAGLDVPKSQRLDRRVQRRHVGCPGVRGAPPGPCRATWSRDASVTRLFTGDDPIQLAVRFCGHRPLALIERRCTHMSPASILTTRDLST